MTTTLGISAFYHDSAATLVVDGKVVAAAQEERFTRVKHDPSFPVNAINNVLGQARIELAKVDHVGYYENPKKKARRVAATAVAAGPKASGTYAPVIQEWIASKRKIDQQIKQSLFEIGDREGRSVEVFDHHESHAASAFFPSPFRSAAVLCIDSVGEWETTTIWRGASDGMTKIAQLDFPHSLGLLYSAFTYFCGFKVDSGEYKLMGLAPYGKPRFKDAILRHLIDVKHDGSFRLDWTKFEFLGGQVMTGRAFEQLFEGPRRTPESDLTRREFDLAASVQEVTEYIVQRLAVTARQMSGEENLCLAGGVALNCVANGVVARSGTFRDIWVQPAAGDAGGSLGAAILSDRKHRRVKDRELPSGPDGMSGSLLGPEYSADAIRDALNSVGAVFSEMSDAEIDNQVTDNIAAGGVVGWFQGRMEFGPRALGARSILGDSRSADTQSTMNLRIKFRESFRPFAPSILEEHATDYFDLNVSSPYMLIVAPVSEEVRCEPEASASELEGIDLLKVPRSTIPAVTHVDFSARVQTVDSKRNARYRALLETFNESTGCPVIVNTSFNVRGEPIVNTPEEAFQCFMRTNMDALAIGPFFLSKSDQNPYEEETDWRESIPLD